ncbi:hypothetical protein QUF72_00545 [Desulfobacterales bacterium HSG2]|nr:hypothetical protein [Desulfobacterales bacterium HSG2]MDM8548524.1 hypothetical protein [Desulfobacterales bacterium HSG2]
MGRNMKGTKETLKEAIRTYNDLREICSASREAALRSPNSPVAGKIFSTDKKIRKRDKRDIINEHFDSLQRKITEFCILDIVATFEKSVFRRIGNAYGEIKNVVEDGYEKRLSKREPIPFYIASSSFVKDREDIRNLSGVKKLLENKIPEDLFEKLTEIIEHRNWLSHGKRANVGKESGLRIDEMYDALNQIFDRI